MRKFFVALARFSPLILMLLGFAAVFTFYRGIQKVSQENKYMAQLIQQSATLSNSVVTTSTPYELIAMDIPEYELVFSTSTEESASSLPEELALSAEEEFSVGDLPTFAFTPLPPPPETFSVNKYPEILKKIDAVSARVNEIKQTLENTNTLSIPCSLDLCLINTLVINNDNTILDCGGKTLMPIAADIVGVAVRASHAVVTNCTFDRFRTAFEVEGSDNVIFGNTIRRSEKDGARVMGDNNVLFNNVISGNNGKGVIISGTDTMFIGNTVGVNTESGIVLEASRGFIARNGVDGNAVGVAIVGGVAHTVFDNAFSGSILGSGLTISSVSNSQFIGNIIKGNTLYGMSVFNSQSNVFAGNTVSGNTKGGAQFDDTSSGNTVRLNDMRENNGECSLKIPESNSLELNKLDQERCS